MSGSGRIRGHVQGRGRGDRGGGRGGDRGRGGSSGRGGRGPNGPSPTEALSNLIVANVTHHFKFFQYGLNALTMSGKLIDSRRRRSELFFLGLKGLLVHKGMKSKDIEDLKRVVFFEGSFCFSARPIPGLKLDELPKVLVGSKERDLDGNDIPISDNGDSLTVVNCSSYCAPVSIGGTMKTPSKQSQEVTLDKRCSDCTQAFTDLEAIIAHCKATGHKAEFGEEELKPAKLEIFLSFCNVVLQRAMGERMAR